MPFPLVSRVCHATPLGGRGAQRAGPPLPQQHSFSLTFLRRVRAEAVQLKSWETLEGMLLKFSFQLQECSASGHEHPVCIIPWCGFISPRDV